MPVVVRDSAQLDVTPRAWVLVPERQPETCWLLAEAMQDRFTLERKSIALERLL
jgi:hypothetical protein